MRGFITVIFCCGLLTGCAQLKSELGILTGGPKVKLKQTAMDPQYGHTPEKPVKVGGFMETGTHQNQMVFLQQLRGPNGEELTYQRMRPCCPFPLLLGFGNEGMLDVYSVSYDGSPEGLTLYLNSYEYNSPQAPQGFTIVNQ